MTTSQHPAGHVLQAFHDGELRGNELAAVEAHCKQCAECRNELTALAETTALLAAAPTPELSRTVWHRVKPNRSREPRFRPVFAFAAGAAGVVLGILIGPIQMTATAEDETTTRFASATFWEGGTTAPLLEVFPTGQD